MLIRSELSFLFPYTFAFLLLSSSLLFIYLFSIYYIYNSLYFHCYVSHIRCNNNRAQNLQLFGYRYRENSCSLYFLLIEFYKPASKFHHARFGFLVISVGFALEFWARINSSFEFAIVLHNRSYIYTYKYDFYKV